MQKLVPYVERVEKIHKSSLPQQKKRTFCHTYVVEVLLFVEQLIKVFISLGCNLKASDSMH